MSDKWTELITGIVAVGICIYVGTTGSTFVHQAFLFGGIVGLLVWIFGLAKLLS